MLIPLVVDTSVASLMLREDPLLDRYRPYLVNVKLIVSFQTIAELRFGAIRARWGERRRQQLEIFIRRFDVVEYTDDLATHWAEVMYEVQLRGRRLEVGDGGSPQPPGP